MCSKSRRLFVASGASRAKAVAAIQASCGLERPAYRSRIGTNPRPNRTHLVVRVDEFETLHELFEEKTPAATPNPPRSFPCAIPLLS